MSLSSHCMRHVRAARSILAVFGQGQKPLLLSAFSAVQICSSGVQWSAVPFVRGAASRRSAAWKVRPICRPPQYGPPTSVQRALVVVDAEPVPAGGAGAGRAGGPPGARCCHRRTVRSRSATSIAASVRPAVCVGGRPVSRCQRHVARLEAVQPVLEVRERGRAARSRAAGSCRGGRPPQRRNTASSTAEARSNRRKKEPP